MSRNTYKFDEEIEVNIKLKITDIVALNHHILDSRDLDDAIGEFKDNITDHIKDGLVSRYDGEREIGYAVDSWKFEIK